VAEVLFKTDLAAKDLPLIADGDVNEKSRQLTSVADSGDALKAGATESFKTESLSPGHYGLGMKLNITVQPASVLASGESRPRRGALPTTCAVAVCSGGA